MMPCSRVGHVFGGMGHACSWPGKRGPANYNKWRAIEIWMDDKGKDMMQKFLPRPDDLGDLSHMRELRDKKLKCRNKV